MGQQQTRQLQSGVRIRNNKIVIDFYYNDKRCRETLQLEPTPKNLKYAAQLRAAILFEIDNGNFSYTKHFPKSKNAISINTINDKVMVKDILLSQLKVYQQRHDNGKLQYSTYMPYKRTLENQLIPKFGELELIKLTPVILRDWVQSLELRSKTFTNIFIPFNAALNEAVIRGYIDENPIEKAQLVQLVKALAKPKINEINPFNSNEQENILTNSNGQMKNLIQFGFYSGLRIGELIALRWIDIDFDNEIINVKRNIVHNKEKMPKTASGIRQVMMLQKAKVALLGQLEYRNDDEFVFHNPNTKTRWLRDSEIRRHWIKVLKSAEVEYRYPYQMRHTYASMLLSNGENIAWIATQMGHINTEMIIRNYGKFIPDLSIKGGYQIKGKY